MARTKQKLINFHSSGNAVVPFSDLEYGEIAVRHRTQPGESELIIKTSTTSGVSFVEKSKVQTMISEGVSQVTTDMTEMAKSLSAVSATVVSVETTLGQEITNNGNFHEEVRTNLSGHVATLTQNLSDNYYTKGQVDSKISTINTNTGQLSTDLNELSAATTALSASVQTMSADVKSYIDDRLTTVYKFKGTKQTYAELPNNAEEGDVWNVVSAVGDSGSAGYTPAGTNYAWVPASEGVAAHWDALGGTIDLTGFATKEDLQEIDTESTQLRTDLTELSAATTAFMETVANTYAESGDVVTEIGKASGAAVTSANSYTDTKLADYYTTGQVDIKLSTINTNTGKLSTDLAELSGSTTALSASVQTIETKANSALQGFEFTGTNVTTSGTQTIQSGAKANYTTGGTATLDLSELVIDCGNW